MPRRPTRIFLLVLAYSLALFSPAAAAQTTAQSPASPPDQYRLSTPSVTLATRLIPALEEKYTNRKIAVLDFTSSDGRYSQLGPWLADQSSGALARSPKLLLVDRAKVHATLERAGLQPGDLDSLKSLERLAKDLGAEVVVRGWFVPQQKGLSLSLSAVAFKPKLGHIGNVYSFVPVAPDIETLAGGPLEDSKFTVLPEVGLISGLTYPRCDYCPNPTFTNDARAAKFSGTVLLELTVKANGRPADIEVLRYAGYGLEREAIRVVQSWRFTPARDGAGNRVPTRVPIEIHLRLF